MINIHYNEEITGSWFISLKIGLVCSSWKFFFCMLFVSFNSCTSFVILSMVKGNFVTK